MKNAATSKPNGLKEISSLIIRLELDDSLTDHSQEAQQLKKFNQNLQVTETDSKERFLSSTSNLNIDVDFSFPSRFFFFDSV